MQDEPNEHMPGKERHVEFYTPIAPAPNGAIYGQKALDPTACNLGGCLLFVIAIGICRIPVCLRDGAREQLSGVNRSRSGCHHVPVFEHSFRCSFAASVTEPSAV